MIRMMMWNPKTGDESFKVMMRDFVSTYRNQPATTEDFKAMVEKHMPRGMDLTGDGKLDWFFNEYVYGTALPSYRFDYKFEGSLMNMSITQSKVNENFRMVVPIYVELANGRTVRLGTVAMTGNDTLSQKIDFAQLGLKDPPKRVLLNYFNDVLCDK
jgi:hypothetical protein